MGNLGAVVALHQQAAYRAVVESLVVAENLGVEEAGNHPDQVQHPVGFLTLHNLDPEAVVEEGIRPAAEVAYLEAAASCHLAAEVGKEDSLVAVVVRCKPACRAAK